MLLQAQVLLVCILKKLLFCQMNLLLSVKQQPCDLSVVSYQSWYRTWYIRLCCLKMTMRKLINTLFAFNDYFSPLSNPPPISPVATLVKSYTSSDSAREVFCGNTFVNRGKNSYVKCCKLL